jgi:hypothetical protein
MGQGNGNPQMKSPIIDSAYKLSRFETEVAQGRELAKVSKIKRNLLKT